MNKKYFSLFFLSLFLISGCSISAKPKLIKSTENDDTIQSSAHVDDIDGWDILMEDIEDMCFLYNLGDGKGNQEVSIDDADKIRILDAYNAVQKKDVYWDRSNNESLYGANFANIKIVLKDGSKKLISINPFLWIDVDEWHYFTNYQLEFYDVLRELQPKYNYPYVDYEKQIPNYEMDGNGLFTGCENNFIVSSDKEINATLEIFNYTGNYDNQTFNDLLEPFINEIELNDVVKTKDLSVKVIEIKDNRVTTVAVTFND